MKEKLLEASWSVLWSAEIW